jgi:hypothetical protein
MKRVFSIFIALFFCFTFSFAQKTIDDGGKTNNNNNNNDGDVPETDNPCLNTTAEIIGILFGSYQSKLVSSTYSNPSVNSFEIMLHGGVSSGNGSSNIIAMPRLRLNSGALSGDIRYTYTDNGDYEPGSVLDVVADFNIVAGDAFKLSLGQGIMYDLKLTDNAMFHESFIGMDLGIMDSKLLISPEFRLAYDWNISKPVNSELTLRGGYRLIQISSFSIYANLAAAYQYLNPGINKTLVYGGFDFYIR